MTNAVPAVASLPRVDACLDAAQMRRLPLPSDDARDEVVDIRAELSRVDAMARTGAYDEGWRLATDVTARAQGVAWPPLVAAAQLREGGVLVDLGRYEEAAATLEAAYFEAALAGADEEAWEAAVDLVDVIAVRLKRPRDAQRWVRHAEVVSRRLPDPSGLREGKRLVSEALVGQSGGEYEIAAERQERALALYEDALGPVHPAIASMTSTLGNILRARGDFAGARTRHERALAVYEEVVGPNHPYVAASINDLANVLWSQGEHREAGRMFERSLAIQQRALGAEHPSVAATLNNLASARGITGDHASAAELLRRSLSIQEKALGPDHPAVAQVLNNLAIEHRVTGDLEEASVLLERAIAIRERALGPEHPALGQSLTNLALVRQQQGRLAEAAGLSARALAVFEAALGPDHPSTAAAWMTLGSLHEKQHDFDEAWNAYSRAKDAAEKAVGPEHPLFATTLLGLATAAIGQGRGEDAETYARRALAVRERGSASAVELAHARLVVAQALVTVGRDAGEARALARQAYAVMAVADDADPESTELARQLSGADTRTPSSEG